MWVKTFVFRISVLALIFVQYNFAQVGIGTTNPQATLHVEGNLRITNTANTAVAKDLIGVGNQGDVTKITVGDGLSLTGNVLSTTTTTSSSTALYKVADIPIITTAPNQVTDGIFLDLSGVNKDVVIFRITGTTHNYSISGIAGGVDGRHIILYNPNNVNLKINSMSSVNLLNAIDTLGSSTQTNGVGTIELVYDGTTNKWLVINIRS